MKITFALVSTFFLSFLFLLKPKEDFYFSDTPVMLEQNNMEIQLRNLVTQIKLSQLQVYQISIEKDLKTISNIDLDSLKHEICITQDTCRQ